LASEIIGSGLLKGLKVTFKTLFKRPVTVQYPEQKLTISRRERGTVLAWSAEKCTGCYTCERACPHGCIDIETPEKGQRWTSQAPCTHRCPARVDAARYIRSIAEGKPGEAVAAHLHPQTQALRRGQRQRRMAKHD
jgi:NAD-dependent dihydropyrimidine dehydrogenase PreA subunit